MDDKSIVFKIADKALSVVLLDRFNYIRQIKKLKKRKKKQLEGIIVYKDID